MRYDVMNEYYTEIRLFGKPALFNDMRLEQETVPKGLYLYEVRYDDETFSESFGFGSYTRTVKNTSEWLS